MSIERELKFEAGADVALPDLTRLADGGGVVALPTTRLEAVYYDTPDVRLARWGASLRHRPEEGAAPWTVKLATLGDVGPLRVRHEVGFAGDAGAIPPDAAALVFGLARGAALSPVARLVTRRVRFQVVAGDGSPLAEVDDDEVTAYRGRRVVDRFREIEVELAEGAPERVAAAAAKLLRKAGAVPSSSGSKVQRALFADADEAAAPELTVPSLGRKASVGEVVDAALAAGARRLIIHDPGVRLDADHEAVHQARVATRRLRSDIRTFAPYLDAAWSERMREELSWLGRAFGGVRDADVLGLRLVAWGAELPEADQAGVAALLTKLDAERDTARALLLEALSSPRYAALLDGLVAAATEPPLVGDVGERGSARRVLAKLVAKRWGQLRAQKERAESVEDLHQVRIVAKRARYAAEAGADVLGDAGVRLAKAVAGVQGTLGDVQDAAVAEAWLRRAVRPRAASATALAAGQLLALDRRAGDDALADWPAAYGKAEQAFDAFAAAT